MRHRHDKIQDFLLTTDDENRSNKFQHRYVQIVCLFITAIFYLFHTIRAYISFEKKDFQFITTRPITRVYTSDFRPNFIIESLFLRIAENWQAFWLIYILSFIFRRTRLGYVYRIPDVFNVRFCFLLIASLICQWSSQVGQTSEISCLCLFGCVLVLIVTCRYVTIKLAKFQEKYRSIDWYILRYFALNALFLYTFSMIYQTVCATIESLGLNFTPNASIFPSLPRYTTIGLLILLLIVLLYSILDFSIYKNEFRSIWSPYIFFASLFISPPFRENFHLINEILLWSIFVVSIGILVIRLSNRSAV